MQNFMEFSRDIFLSMDLLIQTFLSALSVLNNQYNWVIIFIFLAWKMFPF